ncbi:MAG: 6-bladed beta-propeller [Cytophagales bacterium]|nr:6-bladed beta-propeller [Cytophagales bacterium]
MPEETLKIDTLIQQLTDSTFLSDIRSIHYSNNRFFISDYKRDQIIILDNDLRLLKALGRKGRGPGELLGVSQLFVNNDTIFSLNDGKRSIELFDTNKYLKTIRPSTSVRLDARYRFFTYESDIYFAIANESFSICKYNLLSDSVFNFGEVKQFRTPKETRIKNHRHLLKYRDFLIAVPNCQPVIEMYGLDGELLDQFDLSDIHLVNDLLVYVKSQELAENSYVVFFSDAYIYKDRLLIQILTIGGNNKPSNNKILELKVTPSDIQPQRILNLGKGWFEPICVTENHIVAFKSNMELVRFIYE